MITEGQMKICSHKDILSPTDLIESDIEQKKQLFCTRGDEHGGNK